MGLDEVNVERPPLGAVAAASLVEALSRCGDEVERHYLEAKSDIDLDKPLGRAKLAKFILGAANRDVVAASRYFQGHAVMVLGVARGAAPGVEPIEALQLQQAVQVYLPSPAPTWDVVFVPRPDGRQVVLVVVDPPQPGDTAFVCQKGFQPEAKHERKHSLRGGGVYVRGDGETREANAEDMRALLLRAAGQASARVNIITPNSALRYQADFELVKRRITERQNDLLAALPKTGPHRSPGFATAAEVARRATISSSLSEPERRSEEQYRKEVEDWAEGSRDGLPQAFDNWVAARWPALTFVLTSDTWLEDVQVTFHLEGQVEGVQRDPEALKWGIDDLLLRRPRKWGPRRMDLGLSPNWARGVSLSTFPPPYISGTGATFKNGGSVTIEVPVGDLRPRRSATVCEDMDMVLLVRDLQLEHVQASWELTARGDHRVHTGRIAIPIANRTVREVLSSSKD